MRTPALLLASVVGLAACGDDTSSSSSAGGGAGQGGGAGGGAGQGGSSAAPEHDLTGAVAYALSADDEARLYRITASGEVAVAVDAEVQEFLPLRDGGVAVSLGSDVWVLRAGVAPVRGVDLGYGLRGQAPDGRIVTYKGFLDPETGATEDLTSPLGDQVGVTEVSRNAVRIFVYAGSDVARDQVLDLATDQRFDIADCNNGEIVSLSPTRVLVDDCSTDEGLLDLVTGTRSPADVDSLTGEAIPVFDGAILLSQTCPGTGPDFGLCHVDPNGVATPITADGESVAPLDYACCGDHSRALATDGVDVVVLDGSGAAAYRVGQPGRRDVAVGKTVVQLSMGEAGEAFYVGASGNSPVLGVIHAGGDGSDDVLDDTRRWAEVRALPVD